MDWLGWFDARDYEIARLVLQRGVAALLVVAFCSSLNQFRPLCGEHGLLPVPSLLAYLRARDDARAWDDPRGLGDGRGRVGGRRGIRRRPRRLLGATLFAWRLTAYSDRRFVAVCWVGIVIAAMLVAGLPQLGPPWLPLIAFLALWWLYLSIVNVGQTFYGFGWEMLICEAAFTVAFLGSDQVPPPLPVLVLVWWLVFRLEFGAGLIKLRGDPAWRDLTALFYHHETQPMPGPLSRQAHLLPRWAHRGEALGNHVAQLVAPWLLFLPQPIASIGAAVVIATQLWLVVTGNFAWLNWITIVLAAGAVSDPVWHAVLPFVPAELANTGSGTGRGAAAASPLWWVVVVAAFTVASVVLAWPAVRNLASRGQLMNASFNRWQLQNAYGAFGSMTRRRIEIVVEGTLDEAPGESAEWREYGFKGKPGEVHRMPRQFAPYHLRLDWLMWFLPLGRLGEPWFDALLVRLLEADAPTLRLLAADPFGGERPQWVRAVAYRYRFATRAEFRETRARWVRTRQGVIVPPQALVSRE